MKKNFFSTIFLLTSFSIFLWTIYKSEIVLSGTNREYYKIYFVLSSFLIFFSYISFYLSRKVNRLIFVFILSFVVVLYLAELYLNIDSENKFEFYKNQKKEDPNITLMVHPQIYLRNTNIKVLPLSGVSNSKTMLCNENGYYSIYNSDRYGFNNPNSQWNKKKIQYFLLGDSFVHGACVNRPNDISSNLRRLSNESVLNVGMSSNGVLSQYATLKEYLPKNTKKILWLIFEGNEIQNLNKELENRTLFKYFSDYNFDQDLKNKQKLIDEIAKKTIENKIKVYKSEQTQFVKLYQVRNTILNKKNKKYTKKSYNFTALKKIIYQGNEFVKQNNSKLYIICLPAVERYFIDYDYKICSELQDISFEQGIPFLDIHKDLFSKNKEIKNFFPKYKKKSVHYNEKGYEKVAEKIYTFSLKN